MAISGMYFTGMVLYCHPFSGLNVMEDAGIKRWHFSSHFKPQFPRK